MPMIAWEIFWEFTLEGAFTWVLLRFYLKKSIGIIYICNSHSCSVNECCNSHYKRDTHSHCKSTLCECLCYPPRWHKNLSAIILRIKWKRRGSCNSHSGVCVYNNPVFIAFPLFQQCFPILLYALSATNLQYPESQKVSSPYSMKTHWFHFSPKLSIYFPYMLIISEPLGLGRGNSFRFNYFL